MNGCKACRDCKHIEEWMDRVYQDFRDECHTFGYGCMHPSVVITRFNSYIGSHEFVPMLPSSDKYPNSSGCCKYYEEKNDEGE